MQKWKVAPKMSDDDKNDPEMHTYNYMVIVTHQSHNRKIQRSKYCNILSKYYTAIPQPEIDIRKAWRSLLRVSSANLFPINVLICPFL